MHRTCGGGAHEIESTAAHGLFHRPSPFSRPKFLLVGGDWFTMAKKRVMFFYDAPITTFYFECMAYLVFAVLFSIGYAPRAVQFHPNGG